MVKWKYLRRFGTCSSSRKSCILKYRWFLPSLKANFRGWQTFSGKRKIVHILGFVGHTVSVPAPQLCCGGRKATLVSTERNAGDFILIKLYFQKQVVRWMWSMGRSLLTLDVVSN